MQSAPAAAVTLSAQSPFTGVECGVPGEQIQAGGQGAAYRDLTLGNQVGAYRTHVDVDIIALRGAYVANSLLG